MTSPDARSAMSNVPQRFAVGATLPVLTRDVTQPMIDAYAKASGDFNPIHVDPEFSRTGPFGRTIAHGLMTLAFVAQMLNDWTDGQFDECGEIDIAFVGPVYTGDHLEISGVVEDVISSEGRLASQVKLICKAGDRQILAGTALQPIEVRKA
ncbi:MaoC family dehydratase [Microvirga antarctica]|uniref:MaoC family dehydratase n=1 Tax=Microvirga antarctica TaxID=2819233 RepID=UPI001B317FC5|nr:MaoC family dehydratase [Microvirga antarctica]